MLRDVHGKLKRPFVRLPLQNGFYNHRDAGIICPDAEVGKEGQFMERLAGALVTRYDLPGLAGQIIDQVHHARIRQHTSPRDLYCLIVLGLGQ